MRIFADHCVNTDVVTALRTDGFEVERALDAGLKRTPDTDIFTHAQQHNRILLTFDRDFGNIIRFDIKNSHGVVIVLVDGLTKTTIIEHALQFFKSTPEQMLKGKLWLIRTDYSIRVWPKEERRES